VKGGVSLAKEEVNLMKEESGRLSEEVSLVKGEINLVEGEVSLEKELAAFRFSIGNCVLAHRYTYDIIVND
jgi:hypothetical protein